MTILVIALLIGITGLFVAAEFAIVMHQDRDRGDLVSRDVLAQRLGLRDVDIHTIELTGDDFWVLR